MVELLISPSPWPSTCQPRCISPPCPHLSSCRRSEARERKAPQHRQHWRPEDRAAHMDIRSYVCMPTRHCSSTIRIFVHMRARCRQRSAAPCRGGARGSGPVDHEDGGARWCRRRRHGSTELCSSTSMARSPECQPSFAPPRAWPPSPLLLFWVNAVGRLRL
jgi:hypothetical protein